MDIPKKQLFIKKSLLPAAGKGLFTRIQIRKGDRIIEYKGRHRLWKDAKKAVKTEFDITSLAELGEKVSDERLRLVA